MENDKPTLPVRYHREKVSIVFSQCQSGQPGSAPHQSPPQRAETRRCNAKRICKIALLVGVILVIAVVVLAMFFFGCFVKSKYLSGCTENADTALPEVKNLNISAISDDSFTVSWQRPQGAFDKYIVEVAYLPEDHDDDNCTDSEEQSVGSCLPMTLMNANETSITCNNVPACSNATVTVLTQSNETRPRTSQGVSLPIFIDGGAPEGFRLRLAYLDFTSVDVLIDVSNVSSCQLGSCYAELQHPSMVKEKLQCDVFSETQGTVRLRGLTTGAPYKCKVSIQNPYSFKQAEKMVDVVAQ